MATLLSLFNKTGKTVYSDFPKDLTLSPVNSDVTRLAELEAIKESIINILRTDRGERPFNPLFGGNIRRRLFDNLTADTMYLIQTDVETAIRNFEPRCNLINVLVHGNAYDNGVIIIIKFSTINITEPVTLTVTLDRVR